MNKYKHTLKEQRKKRVKYRIDNKKIRRKYGK